VADAHLGPASTTVPAFHVEYGNADTLTTYQLALRRCVREGADGLVLLGDLSHSGDEEPLETGVRTAAETELAVWIVSGNHDCFSRQDALADAGRRVGAENVRLLTPEGKAVGEGLRLAGFSVTSGNWGYTAGTTGRPDVSGWGDDECVVWVTHYPAVSFSREVSAAGLIMGTTLRTWRRSHDRCSGGRRRPSWSMGTCTCGRPASRGRCCRSRAQRSSSLRSRSPSSTSSPRASR
jgi:hypothetical protein